MKIREYKVSDREACLKIFKSNIPKFFLPDEAKGFEEFLDKMAIGAYWVVENALELIACGGIGTRAEEGRLHYGIVANSYHKQGIGSQLIKFRLAQLIEKATVKAISLDTSQHNPEFFKKFGFVETSVKENEYGPDLHRHDMRWVLPIDRGDRQALSRKLFRN